MTEPTTRTSWPAALPLQQAAGGRVLVTCASQRPTKCMNTFSQPRQAGAFTAMLRGGRLLSNNEAMELKANGWQVEQEPTDDGIRDHWICPNHTSKEEPNA